MKIIFKCNGGNVMRENNAATIPQAGWIVKLLGSTYMVVEIYNDYDVPKEEEEIEVRVIPVTDTKTAKKQVQVIKVWKQNADSLTADKIYDIVRETEKDFTIVDDEGREKKYKHENFQFRRI